MVEAHNGLRGKGRQDRPATLLLDDQLVDQTTDSEVLNDTRLSQTPNLLQKNGIMAAPLVPSEDVKPRQHFESPYQAGQKGIQMNDIIMRQNYQKTAQKPLVINGLAHESQMLPVVAEQAQ